MRPTCGRCQMPAVTCHCEAVRPFRTEALFVLLVHPKEARRHTGTARIIRSCLPNAELIVTDGPGADLERRLEKVLQDPTLQPWVLFPGPGARDLSREPHRSGAQVPLFEPGRKPAILVIDGTWHQARKMVRTSSVLSSLPRLAFVPSRPSAYRFRKQPRAEFVSSLEAIHELIDRLDELGYTPAPADRAHDNLIEVFSRMVRRQLAFSESRQLAGSAIR